MMLRAIQSGDLDTLFAFQRDPTAVHMAAFTARDPTDRDAFLAWWGRLLDDPSVVARVIDVEGTTVGSIIGWISEGHREVSYWIGREHWGEGHATAALHRFTELLEERPLRARVAADNVASRRVLEKCGFRVIGSARGFANARGLEVDELLLELT